MKYFDEKVIVITGGARGIGEAVTRLFASERGRVVILDLNLTKANKVIEEIKGTGGQGMAVSCDVTSKESVDECVELIIEKYGRIDILVNNAGILRDNLLFRMSEDDWDSVIDTHLKGAFLCSKAAQKYMVQQGFGKIIMLSSRGALGTRGQTNYSAAKAGLQGMTKTMAIELGPFGINVNAVAPGFIETEMTKEIAERTGLKYEEVKAEAVKINSIKRVGKPEDIAHAIRFLCSDESDFITGQVLYVTGRPVN